MERWGVRELERWGIRELWYYDGWGSLVIDDGKVWGMDIWVSDWGDIWDILLEDRRVRDLENVGWVINRGDEVFRTMIGMEKGDSELDVRSINEWAVG